MEPELELRQCEHISGDGLRCLSPTMHRRHFCFLHWRLREHKLPITEPAFELPIIDSEASAVLASTQIAHAILAGRIDAARGRVIVQCLNIAVRSMRRQPDVHLQTEIELTPAMEQQFAAEEQARHDYEGQQTREQKQKPQQEEVQEETPFAPPQPNPYDAPIGFRPGFIPTKQEIEDFIHETIFDLDAARVRKYWTQNLPPDVANRRDASGELLYEPPNWMPLTSTQLSYLIRNQPKDLRDCTPRQREIHERLVLHYSTVNVEPPKPEDLKVVA
jgi:hypothetical protein